MKIPRYSFKQHSAFAVRVEGMGELNGLAAQAFALAFVSGEKFI
jgi:hypothetical protein